MKDKQHKKPPDGGASSTPDDNLKLRSGKEPDNRTRTLDSNSPRTRDKSEQVNVWEEEGGSPTRETGATKAVKPKTASKDGSMRPAKES